MRLCPLRCTLQTAIHPCAQLCIESKCAWWDANVEQCAVLNASVVVSRIEAKLEKVTRNDLQGYESIAVTDWGG